MFSPRESCPCLLCGKETKRTGTYYTASGKTVSAYESRYYGIEKKTAHICAGCSLDLKHRKFFWILIALFVISLIVSLVGECIFHANIIPVYVVALISPILALYLIFYYLVDREPGDLAVKYYNEKDPDGIYLEASYVKMLDDVH